MSRYAAFLRGINLGNRRVTGPDLCAPFADLGLLDVSSFLASGNVVFSTATRESAKALTKRIESQLQESLGYPVVTFLRDESELAQIVEREPFSAAELRASNGKPQVMLLASKPSPKVATAVLAHASKDDRLAIHSRELHWLPVGNMSASELDVGAIAKLVGDNTVRTSNTIARLYAKYFAAT